MHIIFMDYQIHTYQSHGFILPMSMHCFCHLNWKQRETKGINVKVKWTAK